MKLKFKLNRFFKRDIFGKWLLRSIFIIFSFVFFFTLFFLKVFKTFAINDETKTWIYNTSLVDDYFFNASFVSIDNTGAYPINGVNKIVNPSFVSDNSSWSVTAVAGETTPNGWLVVPANSTFSINDFLVMKYEAKCALISNLSVGLTAPVDATSLTYTDSGSTNASNNCTAANSRQVVSLASGYSISTIGQAEAGVRCTTITLGVGETAHLISNNEWTTIANNIEQQPSNWSLGAVGSGYLFAGHNDNNPSKSKISSTTDTGDFRCAYTDDAGVTENPSPCPSSTANNMSGTRGNQIRVHLLSNGSAIWDFTGNTWEWTNDLVQRKFQPLAWNGSVDSTTKDYSDYASGSLARYIKSYKDSSPFQQINAEPLSLTYTHNATFGIGRINHYSSSTDTDTTKYSYRRGGSKADGLAAGAFAIDLSSQSGDRHNYISFRCASGPLLNAQTWSSSVGRGSSGGNTVTASSLTDGSLTQSLNVGDTSTYDFSAYIYDNTVGNVGGTISEGVVQLYYNGAVIATNYDDNDTDGWYKLSGTITGEDASKTYGVLVKSGKTVIADDFTLSKTGDYTAYTKTAYTADVSSWDSFSAGESASGDASIGYQVCLNDGSVCDYGSLNRWRYYTDGTWANAVDSTTVYSNISSQLTTTAMQSLPVDSKKIAFKAIFSFGGIDFPILNSLSVGYSLVTPTPTATPTPTTAQAPTISEISSSVSNLSAVIGWKTDIISSSKIDYGLTNDYGSTTNEENTAPRVLDHSLTLPSLLACTTYHYRVKSKNAGANETISSDGTFTTTGCVGSATVDSQVSSLITIVSGGTINLLSESEGVALNIPASFSESNANFQIKKLDKTATINTTSTPAGYSTIGTHLYDFKALSNVSTSVSSFEKPITVDITYGTHDIDGINESSLKIYRWNGSVWSQLSGCSVNTLTKTVSCTTSAFSVFGLFGQTSTSLPSNNNTSASAPACSDQSPGVKAPWLYGAIAQDFNSVLLYFTEAGNPVDKYVLEYGMKSGSYLYGVQDMGLNSRGQMTFLVKSLLPDTIYYFRVRGGNGCATGPWSNEISVKTKNLVLFNQLEIVQLEMENPPIKEEQITNVCQIYIVKDGDCLWSIAKKLLKDGNRYKEIIEQNRDKYPFLNTSNILEIGLELKINCRNEKKTELQETLVAEDQNGYDVKIKVLDTEKKPVEGAKVTIHSNVQETITNKDGIANFKNIVKGGHKVFITYRGFEGEESISLTGSVKEFNINVTVKQKAIVLPFFVYGIIGIMGLTILVLVILLKRRTKRDRGT